MPTTVTRFPPSPTGYLHIGGARTALFSWLHARQRGGRFLLRIEDTDRQRSTDTSVRAILDSMAWLELDYDEEPVFQSRRMDRYRQVIDRLLTSGWAYRCYCTKQDLEHMRKQQRARGEKPKYNGRCRVGQAPPTDAASVVRFKNPREGTVIVDDLIKGKIIIDNRELDDLIIARSDSTPTYNLTVVVDDMDMGITHVIRGDDHINNTPRQINILKALGADLPIYAHVPMILGEDGKRMSKRHGAVSVMQYREDGYLPHALLNYLIRLGWAHGDQEKFSRDQMLDMFDIRQVQRGAAVFSPEKLQWLNYEYIKAAAPAELLRHAREHFEHAGIDIEREEGVEGAVRLNQDRSKTLKELVERSLLFFRPPDHYDPKAANKHFTGGAAQILTELIDAFRDIDPWSAEHIHDCLHRIAERHGLGLGKIAQPVRVAVAGVAVSPPIDETLALLGKMQTLDRIQAALNFIAKGA